jgi:hypothetical protein
VVAKPSNQPKRHSNLPQYRDRSIGWIVRMAVERNRITTRHRDDDQTEVFGRIYSLECRTAPRKQEGRCGSGSKGRVPVNGRRIG